MATTAWYDYDQNGAPTTQSIRIGRLWTFRYKVPEGARDTLPPAKGLDVSGIARFTSLGCVGATGFGARVLTATVSKPARGGDPAMVVEIIEPQGYTANATGPEIRGSRAESRDKNGNATGEMLFVSADRTTGIPVPGTTYFTDMDGATESGATGRICRRLSQDDTTIPGLIYTRAMFGSVRSEGYVTGVTPAAESTLDKYLVSKPKDIHAAYYASQQWILQFEIPIAVYTTAWVAANLPDVGDSPSGAMSALVEPNVGGTLIHRRVGYYVKPDFVGITLVYGWRSSYFDSLTRVSSRLVTVHRKRTLNSAGTKITGPVPTTATTRETQRYVLDDDDEEATYTQITITSIVSAIPAAWQSANRNNRNSDIVTIRGVTFGVGDVLYVGGASEDIQASQSPTGAAALRMKLILMAGATAWPLTTDRYIETITRVKVNVMEGGVKKGDGTAIRWVKDAARTDEQTIRGEFAMGAAISALP